MEGNFRFNLTEGKTEFDMKIQTVVGLNLCECEVKLFILRFTESNTITHNVQMEMKQQSKVRPQKRLYWWCAGNETVVT